jgi:two-component system, NtrC family, response regulator AtoC
METMRVKDESVQKEDGLGGRHNSLSVLIVDDRPQSVRTLLEILARKGLGARLTTSKKAALESLGRHRCDLMFLGTRLGGTPDESNGFALLQEVRLNAPEMPVVMLAEPAASTDKPEHEPSTCEIAAAVRAIQAGCRDFLLKPVRPDAVEKLLDTLLPNHDLAMAAVAKEGDRSSYKIVGHSPKLLQTIALADKIAPTSVPVLISGESGTGKELISLLVHQRSKRALGPFVRVNCAALSETLLESELFGHEKGAFTGALVQRKGRFEMAHGGTLMLDEITETPPQFQAKLLRILEQQEFERVGGSENIKVNVRIISTTNRDLLHEVQCGRFRQDLYYRLSTARVVIRPLRERREDLPELVWHFVNLYAREAQRHIVRLDPAMMDIFAEYAWPGNVRQLRNVVLTSLILGVGPVLSLADVSWLFDELQPLPQHGTGCELRAGDFDPKSEMNLGGMSLADLERRAILETLRRTSGNQTRAAKVLGISDRTLREKMRRYRQEEQLQTVG